ncbi:MAG: mRNA surveillance protein pelota [Candidatus Micrarchaeota archaeon]|nr:mRNA surveillance protein pelota [Candidatus Micrarchaeota archaeon]
MRIIRYNDLSGMLKVEPDSLEDLYLLAIVIAKGDKVEAKSYRRFRPNEKDTGEQKEVFVRLESEKVEIDKNSGRLRISGKIISGKPEEFVNIGSYHTINIGPGDAVAVEKEEWKAYVLRRIKQAVAESKKPRIGIIALDDEKATVSYIRGYGIEIVTELYSHLSKRMSSKDYERQRDQYFNDIIKTLENMNVNIIILGGPGFTKDDIRKYMKSKNIEVKKQLAYAPASDAERSGIREILNSSTVADILQRDHLKWEFAYMNRFLDGLRAGVSHYGAKGVKEAIEEVNVILVNDDIINNEEIKAVLDLAERRGRKIEIFNSGDDAGVQLKGFKGIAAMSVDE